MFPNMMNSSYSMEPGTTGPSSLKEHRGQLHLQSLSNSGNNGHGMSSFSTRVPSSGSSPTSSEASSAFISPAANSSHHISSSTSFKFSLLNTVRKAFKKSNMAETSHSNKEPSHHSSQGNLNKIVTQPAATAKSAATTANTPQSPIYISQYESAGESLMHKSGAQQPTGRNRSSTYDSSAISGAVASAAFKQQLKQLQQEPLSRQNENAKISGRKLFKSEKVCLPNKYHIQKLIKKWPDNKIWFNLL